VHYNGRHTLKTTATQTTAGLYRVRVYWQMGLQILRFIETFRTLATNVRLRDGVMTGMFLQVARQGELLPTDATRQPSTFVV